MKITPETSILTQLNSLHVANVIFGSTFNGLLSEKSSGCASNF